MGWHLKAEDGVDVWKLDPAAASTMEPVYARILVELRKFSAPVPSPPTPASTGMGDEGHGLVAMSLQQMVSDGLLDKRWVMSVKYDQKRGELRYGMWPKIFAELL